VSPKQILALAAVSIAVVSAIAAATLYTIRQERRAPVIRSEAQKNSEKPQTETKQTETESEVDEKKEIIEAEVEKPADYNPFYLGKVSILETITQDMHGQIIHHASYDIAYDSEELLVYDDETKKLYILGRRLTYQSKIYVENHHTGIGETLSGDGEAYGETVEKYGRGGKISSSGYVNSEGVADYSILPVRADVENGIIYTIIPTKEMNWVEERIIDDISTGNPLAIAQETVYNVFILSIPGLSEIDVSEDIVTDVFSVVPGTSVEGVFVFKFRHATYDEVKQFGTELTEEIKIRQEKGELPPDL